MVVTVDFGSNTCTIAVPATPDRADPVTVYVDETGAEAELIFKRGAEGTTFDIERTDERIFLKVEDRFVIEKQSGDSFILVLASKGIRPERAFLDFSRITE